MRKRTNWLLLIIAILMISFLFIYLYSYSGSFISQDIENINSITITLYPFEQSKTETKIVNDIDEINEIYNLLSQTSDIRNNRNPSHSESVQWSPKFEIDIEYIDGKTDHIFSTEAFGSICKYLNSKGCSEDRGYMLGKNELIWKYLLN